MFRQPLGTGTTIDLSQKNCVDLDVVVEDQDTPTVKIGQEDPIIDGANLTAKDGQSATWHWCPSRAQEGEDRYTLVLSADDSDNPKTIKNYLVVLRGTGGGGASCPGAPPAISHTPADETTRLDLAPTATVTDDKGIKDAPLFYYSTTNPGATPDLVDDDAGLDGADQRRRDERPVHRERAEPGRLGGRRARAPRSTT